MTFSIPIWISPPAKVKKQAIIQRIVNDIHSVSSIAELGYSEDFADFFGSIEDSAEVIVTPGDYSVQVTGATAQLVDQTGQAVDWVDITEMLGSIKSTSLLKLNISNDSDNELNMLTGTVAKNPTDDTQLIFNLDSETLPTNTLTNITKIIDARENYPGDGTLDAASLGQRYLINADISETGHPNWGLDAKENDIIEYDGSNWTVVFNSNNVSTPQYVTNSFTSKQFKWTGKLWISSYEGEYNPGFWRLVL